MLRIKMEGNLQWEAIRKKRGVLWQQDLRWKKTMLHQTPCRGCLIERIADTTEGTLKYSWLSKQTIS
jgi:hypothetical protein